MYKFNKMIIAGILAVSLTLQADIIPVMALEGDPYVEIIESDDFTGSDADGIIPTAYFETDESEDFSGDPAVVEETVIESDDFTGSDVDEFNSDDAMSGDADLFTSGAETSESEVMETAQAGFPLTEDLAGIDLRGPTPSAYANAIAAITAAMSKFASNTDQMSKLASFLERFGGVTSAASGVIGILQMVGIIKDPTLEALADIMSEIKDIETTLNQMDKKLDEITQMLIDMAVSDEERDRANNARLLLGYWRDFNTNYVEPLRDLVEVYKGYVNESMVAWWGEEAHEGTMIYYTHGSEDPAPLLTYSLVPYDIAVTNFPKTADNGEAIDQSICIGIPAEFMPVTAMTAFDINTYRDQFQAIAANAIIDAANQGKLNASTAFYEEWAAMSDEGKFMKAASYTNDLMNSVIYRLSCDLMTANNEWVIGVKNAYAHYCDNILQTDSGINALINAMYLTNGFEGEIRDQLIDFCDAMVAAAGYYGMLAITVTGQDSLQTKDEMQEVLTGWSDTVTALANKKEPGAEGSALTGYDNFCYVTKSLIGYDVRDLYQYMETWHERFNYDKEDRFLGLKSDPWKTMDRDGNFADIPAFLTDTYAVVLYHNYLGHKQGDEDTFAQYLNRNGVPWEDGTRLLTNYKGVQTYDFSEGRTFESTSMIGDYFKSGNSYRLPSGDDSDIEKDCFVVRDKVVGDYLDLETGNLSVNTTLAARAAYEEGHWWWYKDELHVFHDIPASDHYHDYTADYHDDHTDYHDWFWSKYRQYLLTVLPLPEEQITATSPLLAFEGISRLNGGSFEIESLGLEPNTLSVEAAASEISVSRHNLQNAEQVIQGGEILTVMDAAGAIEYKIGNIYKVKDGNPEQVSSSSFTINAQNGDLITAKGLGEGSYEMTICITASGDDSHMEGRKVVSIRVDVEEEKLPNPLMVAAKSPSVKASKLKNASITISGKKCFDIQDRKGRLKFTRVSGSEQLSIRRNGAIRVKKGTKKGTYTICVEITAAGNRKYLPATESVEVVVNVK